MESKHLRVWKALKGFLVLMPDFPPVAYGGQSFEPPVDGGPYLIVDDVRFEGQRKYQNVDSQNWQTGSLSIGVMVPLHYNDIQTAEYAGKVADYFKQGSVMEYDGLQVKVSRQPTVSGAGYRDDGYFRVPVIIPWEVWV